MRSSATLTNEVLSNMLHALTRRASNPFLPDMETMGEAVAATVSQIKNALEYGSATPDGIVEAADALTTPLQTQTEQARKTLYRLSEFREAALIAQEHDIPRRPLSDAEAQRFREGFDRLYASLTAEIKLLPQQKEVLPVLHAMHALATQKDLSALPALAFNPAVFLEKHPERRKEKPHLQTTPKDILAHYDEQAEDYFIAVNRALCAKK